MIISANTVSASANVVLMSAVGTTRQLCSPIAPSPLDRMSTGRKSIAFMSTTQTNTVSAIGATQKLSP